MTPGSRARWRGSAAAAVLAAGMCLASPLPGCSKKGGAGASDANQSSDAGQPAAQAVPPKPYIAPAAIYEEIADEYAPCQQMMEGGIVDWSRGVILASGSAKAPTAAPQERLKAQRGAEQAAIRNAILAASGIAVDSRGRFGDLHKGTVEVEATAAGREVIASDWDPATLTASSTVSLPMYGLSGVVRLDGVAVAEPANRRALAGRDPVGQEADLIVIDARRTPFVPCLSPRIVDEKGQVLFDASEIPRGDLAGRHMAVYVTARAGPASSASQPATATGALSHRIILKAAAVADIPAAPGVIALPSAEQTDLCRHPDAIELLKAGRLVIIVDNANGRP
jgi:hypothetical protein